MNLDATVKRVALWATAFIAVATAFALLNRWLIADPIQAAMKEERVARVSADSSMASWMDASDNMILTKLGEIASRQAIFVGAATAAPGTPEWERAQRYLRRNADRIITR